MKNKQNNFLRNSNHQEISNGSSETKTTAALVNNTQLKQVFTSVDLWNIHKKNRTSLSRRRVTSLFW